MLTLQLPYAWQKPRVGGARVVAGDKLAALVEAGLVRAAAEGLELPASMWRTRSNGASRPIAHSIGEIS